MQELPLSVVKLPYSGKDALRARSRRRGSTRCTAAPAWMPSWRRFADQPSGARADVGFASGLHQAGLSIGVFSSDGKPMIMVNLAASREEGAVLATELLRLATVPLTVGRTARFCARAGNVGVGLPGIAGRVDQKGPTATGPAGARQASMIRRGQRLFDGPASRQTRKRPPARQHGQRVAIGLDGLDRKT